MGGEPCSAALGWGRGMYLHCSSPSAQCQTGPVTNVPRSDAAPGGRSVDDDHARQAVANRTILGLARVGVLAAFGEGELEALAWREPA